MTAPMMPGECHPALTEFAEIIRTAPANVDPILIAAPPTNLLESADLDRPIEEPSFRTLALHRARAHHALLPWYGAYVWDVWVDEYGRQIAGEEAWWWPHPGATHLPEWNPGPTFLVGPDGAWWRVNDLALLGRDPR